MVEDDNKNCSKNLATKTTTTRLMNAQIMRSDDHEPLEVEKMKINNTISPILLDAHHHTSHLSIRFAKYIETPTTRREI